MQRGYNRIPCRYGGVWNGYELMIKCHEGTIECHVGIKYYEGTMGWHEGTIECDVDMIECYKGTTEWHVTR